MFHRNAPHRTTSVLVLLAGFFGWSQSLPAAKTGPKPNVNAHLSDQQMEGLIRTKLAKSKLAPEGLTVHVHNHVATWEGKTTVLQHKGTATRMARSAGAVEVVNNIKISEEARKKAADRLARYRNGGAPVKKAALVSSRPT